jgi:hypothetical protein
LEGNVAADETSSLAQDEGASVEQHLAANPNKDYSAQPTIVQNKSTGDLSVSNNSYHFSPTGSSKLLNLHITLLFPTKKIMLLKHS